MRAQAFKETGIEFQYFNILDPIIFIEILWRRCAYLAVRTLPPPLLNIFQIAAVSSYLHASPIYLSSISDSCFVAEINSL